MSDKLQGLDPIEFYEFVVCPTLDEFGLDEQPEKFQAAAKLLLGTALVESELGHLVQTGGGPARGVFQMEPATHTDIWDNYLRYRPDLYKKIDRFTAPWPNGAQQLVCNLAYATIMARVHYRRVPHPLPNSTDLLALALYWKRWYNTYQPEQSHEYVTTQINRFVSRFPKELME